MTLDFSQLIPALVQFPLLIVFVWYTDRMQKAYREESTKREEALYEFLSHERMQRMDAMKIGLEEVKHLALSVEKVAEGVAELAKGISVHDAGAQSRHNEVVRILDTNKG